MKRGQSTVDAVPWASRTQGSDCGCVLFFPQAVITLAQGMYASQEGALWSKRRGARAGYRVAALLPVLQALEKGVLAPGRRVEVQLVESLTIVLVLLGKVCPQGMKWQLNGSNLILVLLARQPTGRKASDSMLLQFVA
jgi:hypothetical protein